MIFLYKIEIFKKVSLNCVESFELQEATNNKMSNSTFLSFDPHKCPI